MSFDSSSFSKTLLSLRESSAYAQFCEKVYGRNLRQLNVIDEEQLQALISSLGMNESHAVLDLGCGNGFISEYLSDVTGARVTGLDFSEDAILCAQKRTSEKRNRVNFIIGEFGNLPSGLGHFDFVLALDTFYFFDDINFGLQQIRDLLTVGGRFAIFYSSSRRDLGECLTNAGFSFQATDFSINERKIWEATLKVAEELRATFLLEGNLEIYEGRVAEAMKNLRTIEDGKISRFLYVTNFVYNEIN